MVAEMTKSREKKKKKDLAFLPFTMSLGLNVLSKVTQVLSTHFRRPLNERFTVTLVKFYLKNNSFDGFFAFINALGLPGHDIDKGKEIYNLIAENIRPLEDDSKSYEEDAYTDREKIPKAQKSSQERDFKNSKKLQVYTDHAEDETGLDENVLNQKIKKVERRKTAGLDFDDEDHLQEEKKQQNLANKIKFKRIDKKTASRIKNESMFSEKRESDSETGKPVAIDNSAILKRDEAPQLQLADLVEMENKQNSPSGDDVNLGYSTGIGDHDIIENDREWYELDENDIFAREASIYPESGLGEGKVTQGNRKCPNRGKNINATGGSYDFNTGEYRDFDHDDTSHDVLSDISISCHYYVPPFLKRDRNLLNLEGKFVLDDSFLKTRMSIAPIKDPDGELATMARQGSLLLRERKAKYERAKQAKDKSTLQGTALGNILGLEEKEKVRDSKTDSKEKISECVKDKEQNNNEIIEQRRSLPAFSVKNDLLRTINENQVTVVIGETGSGKTTQLAQYLFEEGLASGKGGSGNRLIGCTQPRRVAAMSVAKRVSEERGCKLGDEVGYAIRFEDVTTPKKTRIKYMTDGVLLRETLVDTNLDDYSCIIIDEAHERSLSTDILLGFFKKLLAKRKDLKVIVTSATMSADKFSIFFGNAPQFKIPGRTFPVDVFFTRSPKNDYVDSAVKQVLTIHLQNSAKFKKNDGDILVFMSGQDDIEATCELLGEKLNLLDDPPPLEVYPIYSSMPADMQKQIFQDMNAKVRKVVVATNIAETSITIDGIKYVIDTGLVKMTVYNPKLGMNSLQLIPISMASAKQRSGRAGRTSHGIAYRLYTENAFQEQMYAETIPEIQRSNLSNVLLLLKSLHVHDVSQFPFIDPPPNDLVVSSLYELWSIAALDNMGDLTDLGLSMSKFPMDPTLSKLILLSCREEFSCSNEIITIVAMLSVPPVFYRPKERAEELDLMKEKFVIDQSDHLTLANIFSQFEVQLRKSNMNQGKVANWCKRNFFHMRSLVRAREVRKQLLQIMNKNKLPLLKSRSDEDICKCLCASFYHQLAKLVASNISTSGGGEYANLRHSYMKMYLHPTSVLNNGTTLANNFVIYHELVLTNKEYMNCVTCVNPLWLLEFGYIFYELSRTAQLRLQDKIDLEFHLRQFLDFEKQLKNDEVQYEISSENQKARKRNGNNSGARFNPKKFRRRAFN